jgi:hypothetical protein
LFEARMGDLAPDHEDHVVAFLLSLRGCAHQHGGWIARLAGLRAGELLASPFGFRACVMGLLAGATSVPHELRRPVRWNDEMIGGDEVRSGDDSTWDAGVLRIGKYESFEQDARFVTHNPNHIAKWAPHELLHRACRFFWRRDMTRWECYIAARLNELAPVALWYGADEFVRLDRGGFDRKTAESSRFAELGDAAWLHCDESALRQRIRGEWRHVVAGLVRAEAEFSAVDAELRTGRRQVVEHAFLDASSDARAYVVGHWNRLTARSFAELFEVAYEVGVDRFDEVVAYRRFVEAQWRRLLGEPLVVDDAVVSALLRKSDALDRAHRLAHHGWSSLRPLIPPLRRCVAGGFSATDVAELRAAVDGRDGGVSLNGTEGSEDWSLWLEGVESVSPPTARWLREEPPAVWQTPAVRGCLGSRASFVSRLRDVLAVVAAPAAVSERAGLETAIASLSRSDDDVEHLLGRGDGFLAGDIAVPSTAFSVVEVPLRCLAERAAEDGVEIELPEWPDGEPERLLVGLVDGQAAILPAPAVVVDLWAAGAAECGQLVVRLEAWLACHGNLDGWPASGEEWLAELCGAGLFGWAPRLG